MSDVQLQIVRSLTEMATLQPEWDALAGRAGTPLLGFDWYFCCAQTLHAEADLRVVVARHQSEVVGIAPLVAEPGGRRLALLGSNVLFEPGGLLYTAPDALEALAGGIAGLDKCLALSRVPRVPEFKEHLARALRRRALVVTRPAAGCGSVEFTGRRLTGGSLLSATARQKVRAQMAKATRDVGEVVTSRVTPVVPEVDECLTTFMTIEDASWKGRNASSLAHRPDLHRFFRALSLRAATKGELVITQLTIGTAKVAVEIAIEAYQRLWALKIGVDERFASYGPGVMLTEASINASYARGLKSYEFLGTAESWQDRWRPVRRDFDLTLIYPLGLTMVGCLIDDARTFAHNRWRRSERAHV